MSLSFSQETDPILCVYGTCPPPSAGDTGPASREPQEESPAHFPGTPSLCRRTEAFRVQSWSYFLIGVVSEMSSL